MADYYLGEIRMFGGNFAPKNWAFCNGQLMAIVQNTALFSLLGTYYGGDGKTTFALPNLQGRAPMFWGQGPGLTSRDLGEQSGTTTVTLLSTEMPGHSHNLMASSTGGDNNEPAPDKLLTIALGGAMYNPTVTPTVQMSAQSLSSAPGGGQPHNNLQPYLAVTFIIALAGIFPPRQ